MNPRILLYCCYFLWLLHRTVDFAVGTILFSFCLPGSWQTLDVPRKCTDVWMNERMMCSRPLTSLPFFICTLFTFARVPLKNTTGSGVVGREERELLQSNTLLSTFFNAHNPIEHTQYILGSQLFFSSLIFCCWLYYNIVGKQPTTVLPPSMLSHRLSGNCQGHTLL